ncbi:hypothetical protein Y1Q_0023829 [Alligator mississippiensis]|uniref:Uncharacterized protein n=1 Tax=Alligator mississippiensis TaxID=8496 RepID=A0A151MKD4_ALLMI|nr:hypothetical protein Y1Q_0023829 [Alligator mississippiensis]
MERQKKIPKDRRGYRPVATIQERRKVTAICSLKHGGLRSESMVTRTEKNPEEEEKGLHRSPKVLASYFNCCPG